MDTTTHQPPALTSDHETPRETSRTPEINQSIQPVCENCVVTRIQIITTINPHINPSAAQKIAAHAKTMIYSKANFEDEMEKLGQIMQMVACPDMVREKIDPETQVEIVEYAQALAQEPVPSYERHMSPMKRFSECIWRARINLTPVPIM